MSNLNNSDYIQILEFYNKIIPKSSRLLKLEAEKIMNDKLCRCIKKLDPVNEAKSIGICTKTILNSKGYTRGKFKCKGKKYITISKNKTKKMKK